MASKNDVPEFDMLASQSRPFEGFGEPAICSSSFKSVIDEVIDQSRSRVSEFFGLDATEGEDVAIALDQIVADMWREGWDPSVGDLNLFARDLGAVFLYALTREFGGDLVLRSTSDLSHASVFLRRKKIEVFPFHKAFKCLVRRDGESFAQVVRGIRQCSSSG